MPLILPKDGYYEMEEKKSKFIGNCTPVKSEAEAKAFIQTIRNQHKAANHNVFAYSTTEGNITRFSDDGEPGGTAGMPILNVFQKTGIIDFACVVTRYFGGTLLGTGGLVRAYSKSAKGAMESANPEEQIFYRTYRITCGYPNLDKVKYNFNKWDLEILEWDYTDKCQATVKMREDQVQTFLEGDFYQSEFLF